MIKDMNEVNAALKRMQEEQKEQVKQAMNNVASATDSVKDDDNGKTY